MNKTKPLHQKMLMLENDNKHWIDSICIAFAYQHPTLKKLFLKRNQINYSKFENEFH